MNIANQHAQNTTAEQERKNDEDRTAPLLERDFITIFVTNGEKHLKYRGCSYRRETGDGKEYGIGLKFEEE
jgi:hypothetical protein